jgi:hypothetical protein
MKIRITLVAVMVVMLLLSAGASLALADAPLPTDAIAGTWYGNMHFDAFNSVQRVKMDIPAGCNAGDVCGSLQNFPAQCTWELTYDGFSGGKYLYHFSNTLEGSCPAGSAGALTLLPDGNLMREHKTPAFNAWGTLSQRPNADK